MPSRIVYNFTKQRQSDAAKLRHRYSDKTTLIVYHDDPVVACQRYPVDNVQQFVEQYCLNYGWGNGTNFSKAMKATSEAVTKGEKTCIIFLTDGEDSDLIGSAQEAIDYVRNVCQNKKLVKMFMVRIGQSNRPRKTLDKMAEAANTTVVEAPDAAQLNDFLIDIVAKQAVKFSLVTKSSA